MANVIHVDEICIILGQVPQTYDKLQYFVFKIAVTYCPNINKDTSTCTYHHHFLALVLRLYLEYRLY